MYKERTCYYLDVHNHSSLHSLITSWLLLQTTQIPVTGKEGARSCLSTDSQHALWTAYEVWTLLDTGPSDMPEPNLRPRTETQYRHCRWWDRTSTRTADEGHSADEGPGQIRESTLLRSTHTRREPCRVNAFNDSHLSDLTESPAHVFCRQDLAVWDVGSLVLAVNQTFSWSACTHWLNQLEITGVCRIFFAHASPGFMCFYDL